MPCTVEEHVEKLLQFTDLYNLTCVYCRVEDKLSVCSKAALSCIQKKKLKLCFCVWTHMTWPRISESTFPSKIPSYNSWETAQLSKMLLSKILWQSNDLSTILCHQSFLVQCLLSTYRKLFLFLESIWLFLFYDFQTIEYLISLFSSKAASRAPLIIFIASMVSLKADWRA